MHFSQLQVEQIIQYWDISQYSEDTCGRRFDPVPRKECFGSEQSIPEKYCHFDTKLFGRVPGTLTTLIPLIQTILIPETYFH